MEREQTPGACAFIFFPFPVTSVARGCTVNSDDVGFSSYRVTPFVCRLIILGSFLHSFLFHSLIKLLPLVYLLSIWFESWHDLFQQKVKWQLTTALASGPIRACPLSHCTCLIQSTGDLGQTTAHSIYSTFTGPTIQIAPDLLRSFLEWRIQCTSRRKYKPKPLNTRICAVNRLFSFWLYISAVKSEISGQTALSF